MNLLLHQLLINSSAAAAAPLPDDDHDDDDGGLFSSHHVSQILGYFPNPLFPCTMFLRIQKHFLTKILSCLSHFLIDMNMMMEMKTKYLGKSSFFIQV